LISKQIEILLVEHMDEVLSHALILNEGDCLFQKNDIPLEINHEEMENRQSLI